MTHAVPHVVLRVILPLGQKEIIMAIRFITSSFSLNMLAVMTANIRAIEISEAAAASLMAESGGIPSAVGHSDTAAVMSAALGAPVPMARVTVTLNAGDRILVGQYSGPRLLEGATTLPEGATLRWVIVTIE